MSTRGHFLFAVGLLLTAAGSAHAQMPIHLSANGGIAVPLGNEADRLKNGIHAGVGLKIALVPLQFDATFDRMGSKLATAKNLTVLGLGATVPINVTPALLPAGIYLLAGGAIYRTKAEASATDFGVNGGVGVRVGVPGIRLFVEGRGVAILSSVSRTTFATVAAGIRL